MRQTIAVDIKCLREGKTGVAVYLRNTLDWLQRIDSSNRYLLCSPENTGYPLYNPLWQHAVFPSYLPGTLWSQWVLSRRIKNSGADILWEPEQLGLVKRAGPVKLLITIHDLTSIRYPKTLNTYNRLMHALYFKRSVTQAAHIVTVSDFIKRELAALYPVTAGKTTAVPNGCSESIIDPKNSGGCREKFLLCVGTVEPRKNILALVKALEILSARHGIEAPLVVAGPSGWKNQPLHRYISQSPVKRNITFAGFVTKQRLEDLYRQCTALVFPSLYEGFGLPVLEAMAHGCVVLTSKGTVMEEIAGDAALYFDPHDPVDIAGTIRSIYDSAFDGAVLRARGIQVCETFPWEKSARLMLDVFNNLAV